MSFIDRTKYPTPERNINRSKFLRRAEKAIKQGIHKKIKKKKVKDLTKDKKHKVKVSTDGLTLPHFNYDSWKGLYHVFGTGNDYLDTGSEVPFPTQEEGEGGGETGSGELEIELTNADLEQLFFQNLMLPYMYKKNNKTIETDKLRRSGYQLRGNPSQMNYLETMKQLLARQIIFDDDDLWLEEVDVRYNNFTKIQKPSTNATLFCLMDVSGSMSKKHIDTAREFFFMLCMFLQTKYKGVEIRFIRYHSEAEECDEQKFFYGRDTGGTILSNAFDILFSILDKEYSRDQDNVYVCLASDGDMWIDDYEKVNNQIHQNIDWFNYMVYFQVQEYYGTELMKLWEKIAKEYDNVDGIRVSERMDVYDCLKALFHQENFK